MKRRCLKCEYGYTPPSGSSRIGDQYCGFGLKDGAVSVGEYCPMDGKRLQNLRKGGEK